MPILLQDIDDRRTGTGVIPFTAADFPASFPFHRWNYQQARYFKYWQLFTGQIWEETIPGKTDSRGNPALRYPLQINYAKTACMKHSYVLFGEVEDTSGPLVRTTVVARAEPGTKKRDEDKQEMARELEDFVNRVWSDNDGGALQQDAGLIQQALGGTVFKVSWDPQDEDLEYGIRLESILPDFFMPVWDSGRPFRLLEAWVVWRMPAREAYLRFGYQISEGQDNPLYIEHWTQDTINITIGGKPLSYSVEGETFTYQDEPNPFGFVPYVYIPRERAGSYYGLSLLDDTEGIMKEMNARIADMGDVVGEVAHRTVFTRNVTSSPKTMDIGGTRPAVSLGTTPPGVEGHPDAFAIDPPAISDGLTQYPEYLRMQFARDIFVPGVADGEDEGSQRSALTLAFRMYPMTSKVRAMRNYWRVGLILIGKMIAKMAILKGVGGITQEHMTDVDWSVKWSPMIPRDREQQLNEVVLAKQSDILSPVTGLDLLNLVDDPVGEMELVREYKEWSSNLEATTSAASKGPNTKITSPTAEAVMSEPGESQAS